MKYNNLAQLMEQLILHIPFLHANVNNTAIHAALIIHAYIIAGYNNEHITIDHDAKASLSIKGWTHYFHDNISRIYRDCKLVAIMNISYNSDKVVATLQINNKKYTNGDNMPIWKLGKIN